MNDRIKRIYEMTLQALVFMRAHLADFTEIPYVAAAVADLQTETDTIAALAAQKVSTTAAAKDSTISRGDARTDLRDDLTFLAELWRSLAEDNGGAENKFKLSSGDNDRILIAEGRAAVADAVSVQEILTQHGATPAFIAGVQAKTDTFEQVVNTAEAARGERVGTNAAFSEPARRAKKLVEKLSPTVKRIYRNNPQKLAEWLVARHIERPSKSPKPDEDKDKPTDK